MEGNRIDWILEQNGWSKREFCAVSGLSNDTVESLQDDIRSMAPSHVPKVNSFVRDIPYGPRDARVMRKKSGMTIKEFAEAADTNRVSVSKFEKEGDIPTAYEDMVDVLDSIDADGSVYALMDYVSDGWIIESIGWNLERLKKWADKQRVGPKQAIYKFPPGKRPDEKGVRYRNSDLEAIGGEFVYTVPAKRMDKSNTNTIRFNRG